MVRETPRTCNSWLWGSPSSVSSCGEGGQGELALLKNLSGKPTLKKKVSGSRMAFRSLATNLRARRGVRGQGWESRGSPGEWGRLACNLSLGAGAGEGGSWDSRKASIISREWVSPTCSLGQRTTSLGGALLLKGLPHSAEAAGPGSEGPHRLSQGDRHLLLCVLTLVALMSAFVF